MSESSNSGSLSVYTLVQAAFIVLKALGYLQWSWVWVFAPTYAVVALCAIFIVAGYVITSMVDQYK